MFYSLRRKMSGFFLAPGYLIGFVILHQGHSQYLQQRMVRICCIKNSVVEDPGRNFPDAILNSMSDLTAPVKAGSIAAVKLLYGCYYRNFYE